MSITLMLAVFPLWAATTIYVSTDGNDAWSGHISHANTQHTDGPLATLSGARDTARKLHGLKQPINIVIGGGTYTLSEPFLLTPEDSGTADSPITYMAAPGAKPVISGGREIRGWKKSANGLWCAKIQDKWEFSQLFVNGIRRDRTRLPGKGYYRIRGRTLENTNGCAFMRGDIRNWRNLSDVNVVIMHPWETSRMRIESVDTARSTVTFTSGSGARMDWWLKTNPKPCYYVENVYETLGTPGQWYLDRKAGVVYYKPMPGENMRTAKVIAPRIGKLVIFAGDPDHGKVVEHVNLMGLTFKYSDWNLEPGGHGDAQAASGVEATIQADGTHHCAIKRCSISSIGTYAIWFRRGCTYNVVEHCEISDAGAGGVRIADGNAADKEADKTTRNTVRNCFIHDCGIIYPGAIGIFIGKSPDNLISHNEICDMSYSGISLGWCWDYGRNDCERNVIEYNHIYRQGEGILTDGAAIYTLGPCPGTIIRNNVIHDILAGGIYPDMATAGSIVENNIIYRCLNGAYTFNWGKDNIVRNNIFAFCPLYQIVHYTPRKEHAFTFEGNIVLYDTGRLMRLADHGKNDIFDNNLYWHTDQGRIEFANNESLAEWRASGKDKHSIITAPLLRDSMRNNFRLKPNSPALRLGFVPIDAGKAGLEGEPSWVNAPKRKPHKAFRMFIPGYLQAKPLRDDLESTPIGQHMRNAYTGEEKTGTVAVTNETAASGKHSLKFTDAPGLSVPWNPHINYGAHFWDAKSAQCHFDLRLEKSAILSAEWRDDENPYQNGPHITASAADGLKANDKRLMPLPVGKWFRLQIDCGLGEKADGTFGLRVDLPNGEIRRFSKLKCDPYFKRLESCVFISASNEYSVFYIDNLNITQH